MPAPPSTPTGPFPTGQDSRNTTLTDRDGRYAITLHQKTQMSYYTHYMNMIPQGYQGGGPGVGQQRWAAVCRAAASDGVPGAES